jgi:tetratricopeptide (TPR) repeat protein
MNLIKYMLFISIGIIFGMTACQQKPKEAIVSTGNPEIDGLTQVLQEYPQNDSLWAARAEAYAKAEDFDNAIRDLAKAMSIDSVNVKYHHQLSDAYMDSNKSLEAIRTMERAAALYPERIPTLLKLAECYLTVQQYEPALKMAHSINVIDPKNDEGYYMMGCVLKEMGERERATKAFQNCVANNSDNVDGWVELGLLYDAKKDPKALQCFDNALRLDSLNTDILYNKALYFQNRKEDEKAKKLYRQIIGIDRKYVDALFNMGILQLENKDSLQKAFTNFNISVQTDPQFSKGYYLRGICYERLGKIEEARKDYQQAINLFSEYTEAKNALDKLNRKFKS